MTVPLLVSLLVAQPPAVERVRVDWLLPEGCPDQAALTTMMREAIGQDRAFTASVRVDEPQTPGRPWRAVVTTRGPDGAARLRAVDAPDCARVTEAAVLVLTLAATAMPEAHGDEGGPAVLPPPPPVPDQAPPAPDEPPPASEPEAGADGGPARWLRPNLRVQLLGVGTLGVLPTPGGSVGVGLAFAFGRLRVEAALLFWPETRAADGRRGARFDVTSARVRGCWLFEPADAWFLGPCGGAEVAFVRATGLGVTAPTPIETTPVTVQGGLTAARALSPLFRVFGGLDLGFNVVQPQYVLGTPTGAVAVHRTGLLSGRLTLGLEVYLP
ncbi:MAG: hypothetical protein INH41_25465 [Myxococcaceae bacterium]|jgi:hypothetical protein|nr:hypothetical protein [Myxococcaceae bacterium]MCA3015749.1 hypothetical protein [Myxococcaceae bacterium]